jgi:hypothetical protein
MTDDQILVLDFLLDDHFALWDFADSFPSMHPDAVDSQTAVLLDLVSNGFVEITFGRWIENETTPVPVEAANAALLDAVSWSSTGREPGYVLDLTQAGREFLRQRGIDLPL